MREEHKQLKGWPNNNAQKRWKDRFDAFIQKIIEKMEAERDEGHNFTDSPTCQKCAIISLQEGQKLTRDGLCEVLCW